MAGKSRKTEVEGNKREWEGQRDGRKEKDMEVQTFSECLLRNLHMHYEAKGLRQRESL